MTWLERPADSLFGVANLPYGVFDAGGGPGTGPRVGVRIGDAVLDLTTRRSPGRR
jgi:fumarylacetoacetase